MITTKALTLDDLAEAIRREHDACEDAMRTPLAHALEVGRLLKKAKEKVSHGEWGGWIKDNCGFSHRSASGYMRLAEKLPNRQPVANLGVREALEALAEPFDEFDTSEMIQRNAARLAAGTRRLKARDRREGGREDQEPEPYKTAEQWSAEVNPDLLPTPVPSDLGPAPTWRDSMGEWGPFKAILAKVRKELRSDAERRRLINYLEVEIRRLKLEMSKAAE